MRQSTRKKNEIKIRREEDLATLLWFLNTLFIVSCTSTAKPQTHTHDLLKEESFFCKMKNKERLTHVTRQGTTVCRRDFYTIERF